MNGAARAVVWGSALTDIADGHRRVELVRPYLGQLGPVEIDRRDDNAHRLALLSGEGVKWH